ncbi:DNA polymerase IV [Candidatus Woesearchaeota archaeon]|nr:DNA polymerase IV [Candidatus Woesearchaeota archaeon]
MSTKAPKEKVIFHIDADAFFVGVEVAKNPKLKGLPVVTGEERGIVSALSYEAKALGVVRGMPISRVKREFPHVIVLPGDYRSYVEYSERMFEIVNRYAYGVEEYSIDECFADFTGLDRTLKKSYREIAEQIKKEINDELELSVSIGLASTKVLAKIASNWVKPNGLTIIEVSTAPEFLAKVPVNKIWGIGPKTSEQLVMRGVKTALDFSAKDISWVRQNFSKPYEAIWHELNGVFVNKIDSELKTTYLSIQKTRTFHPATNDKTFLWSQISKHIEDACAKARHYNLVPKKISIFLKTQDFEIVTVSATLSAPSNSPEILAELAHEKLDKIHTKGILYRTAGVVLQDLLHNYTSQKDLFGGTNKADKLDIIHKQIDALEDKLGKRVVYLASTKKALDHKTIGTEADELDRDLLFL